MKKPAPEDVDFVIAYCYRTSPGLGVRLARGGWSKLMIAWVPDGTKGKLVPVALVVPRLTEEKVSAMFPSTAIADNASREANETSPPPKRDLVAQFGQVGCREIAFCRNPNQQIFFGGGETHRAGGGVGHGSGKKNYDKRITFSYFCQEYL
jgi:hypothetical protein